MNQKNSTLLMTDLTVALIAALAVAPILSEMAYATTSGKNIRNNTATNGANGTNGHVVTSIRCDANGCTASAAAIGGTGGGGGNGGGPGGGHGGAGGQGALATTGSGVGCNPLDPRC